MISERVTSKLLARGNEIGVINAAFKHGQVSHLKAFERGEHRQDGVDLGPGALISDGLLKELEEPSLGYTLIGADYIHTYHSLIPPTNEDPVFRSMNRPIAVSAVNKRVTEQVYEHASKGRYVLTLGGDHSLAVGTIAGLAQAVRERHQGQEIAVIWVDAHADINTPETTRTGNIHGMPLSFATGIAREDRDDVFGWIKPAHLLNPKKLVYIAIRAVGQGELGIIRDHGIKAFTMEDVVERSIGAVMDQALEYIGADTPILLSFDIDALDPVSYGSTGTPSENGLTLRQGQIICDRVQKAGTLVAMDLVEINPLLQPDLREATVAAGASLVRRAFGESCFERSKFQI